MSHFCAYLVDSIVSCVYFPSCTRIIVSLAAIHLWRPHGGRKGVRSRWTHVDGGGVSTHVDVHTEN